MDEIKKAIDMAMGLIERHDDYEGNSTLLDQAYELLQQAHDKIAALTKED